VLAGATLEPAVGVGDGVDAGHAGGEGRWGAVG
jgi:hypothetical protein